MRCISSILLTIAVFALPKMVSANISYTPWVHELVQKGADMEITVQIFDETTAANDAGEPLPGLDAKYTLKRGGVPLFEERVFDPDDAYEVTELICHPWSSLDWEENDAGEAYGCADSDSQGECPGGFCGVAYRYKFIDHCPPDDGELMYWMYVTPEYDLVPGSHEGLGFTNTGFDGEEAGGECSSGSDSGCSAAGVVGSGKASSLMRLLLYVLRPVTLGDAG